MSSDDWRRLPSNFDFLQGLTEDAEQRHVPERVTMVTES